MNILESLLYGLISGLTEFLPLSSRGHQAILKNIMGASDPDPIREIFVHIGVLLAIIVCCGTYIEKLRRDQKTGSRRRRARHQDSTTAYDLRLIKTAGFPMLIGMLLSGFTGAWSSNLALIALFYVVNGLFLYIPEHMPHSNKGAGNMSTFDSVRIGLSGALAILPGMSRVGCALSCAIASGADRQKALNWVLILSIPAIVLLIIFDFISIFTVGIGVVTFSVVVGYILAAIAAFAAACGGICMMQFLTFRSGIGPFAYYCWGMALLSFVLYLTA